MGVNWLDNVIGVFSPVAKARRVRARALTAVLEDGLRKYEGAGRGKRTKNWHTPATSANAEIGQDLPALRNRSRDLVRNNCYARRGIAVIRENVVGTGIITEIKAENRKRARKIDALFDAWAERTWCDYDGVNDIYGLQALAISTVAESGECLIRRRRPPTKAGLPVPLQLQVLEGDYLATGLVRTKPAEGNEVIQGIEFDSAGQRVAYHLFERHPGDPFTAKSIQAVRIPASEILHLRDIGRAGQLRGVPWLAAAIIKLRELDDYEDAQLVRQKIAACFAAFVKDLDATGEGATLAEEKIGERLMPGTVQHLPAGKEIVFGNPPAVTGYKEFVTAHIMAVAASLGVTYEALAGDFSQVNFSSARMGWLEFQRNITGWQQRIMTAQFMLPLFGWFREAAELQGIDVTGITPDFTYPRREMIDPTKEIPAMTKAVRAGLATLPQAIKSLGFDANKQLEEIAATNKTIDELGLVLDSDPRKSNAREEKEVNDEKDTDS